MYSQLHLCTAAPVSIRREFHASHTQSQSGSNLALFGTELGSLDDKVRHSLGLGKEWRVGGVHVLNQGTVAEDGNHARLRRRNNRMISIGRKVRRWDIVPRLVSGPAIVDAGRLVLELGDRLLLGFRGEVMVEDLGRVVNVNVITLNHTVDQYKKSHATSSARGYSPRVSSSQDTDRWGGDRQGCCPLGSQKK